MPGTKENIAIAGAGLVGSLMAVFLAKRGYDVKVFERREDPRKGKSESGRSINLALSNRGLKALKKAGLLEKVADMMIPMKGRIMHDTQGELTFQPYGKEDEAINSVSRGGLNMLLMEEAEKLGVKIHFGQRIDNVDIDNTTLSVSSENGNDTVHADLILGADGAFSAIRAAMQISDRFNYEQYYIEHGYKELTIPPLDGEFALDKNALHIWPRGNFMLIALPNLDGSFTCTLFLPFEGEKSFARIQTDEDVVSFFKTEFPDSIPLLPDLVEDYNTNPTSSLVTVRCYPWVKNRTLLIGDAAHAVVPFYGQGMNCGFEDCGVLDDMLGRFEEEWEVLLPEFEEFRKPDADAISDLALQNFIEMRDLVADPDFLLRKKIEARLQELYPDIWIPQYSMVTFNEDIRYSEAQKEGIRQAQIMDEVMKTPGIHDNWESLDFREIVSRL